MDTTHCIWVLLDEGTPLLPITLQHSSHINNAIIFDVHQDTDDGSFPRVSDWTRFVNKIENDGVYRFLNGLTRKKNKLKIRYDQCTIIRDKDWDESAVIEFDAPIKVVFGHVGKEPIIKEVKKIKGEFTHDWFWTSCGTQDKVANGVEIYFNIHEYLE
jgi:hypothetical protein